MKIRELRLKNLNSLYGEWEIDFTDPAYEDSGIFLIAGPTGAGKTTVLDAICLALYGKTPRLTAVNASSNEIMSRHTGDCFAEVVFETNEGLFQSRWAQRRAKSKEDGNLQAQKREISEWKPEKNEFVLLETYTSRVDDVVQEKTGMTFGRFTRSIMLAQGQFAAFLQAKDDDRSETLEQITGTGIYTRISRGVFERHKLEKEKLELIEREVDGISKLSDDEFFEMEIDKSEKSRIIGVNQKKIDSIHEQQEWLRTIAKLKKGLEENTAAAREHKKDIEVFSTKRKTLADAEKASQVRAPWEAMKSRRAQVAGDKGKLKSATKELESAKKEKNSKKKTLSAITEKKKAHEETVAKEQEKIKEVRKLDTQIKAAEDALATASQKADSCSKEIEKTERELSTAKKQKEKSEKELQIHRKYLTENKSDESLVSELPVFREQAGQWQKDEEANKKLQAALPGLQKQKTEASEARENREKELKAGKTQLSHLKKQIGEKEKSREKLLDGKLLRELKKEEETLEERRRLEEKIIDLEAERSRLIAGENCPLCGSTEHPFADGEIPELSETRKLLSAIRKQIKTHDEISDQIQKLTAKRSGEAVSLEKTKGEASLCSQKLESVSKEIAGLEEDVRKGQEELESTRLEILASLKPFGIDLKDDLQTALAALKKREEAWKHHHKEAKHLTETTGESGELLASLSARLKTLGEARAGILDEVKKHDRALSGLRSNRVQCFDEKDPDREESRLLAETQELTESEKKAAEDLNWARKEVTEKKTLINDLSDRLKETEPKLKESTQAFEEIIIELGFADEAAFLAKNLSREEIEDLKQQSERLDKRTAELKGVEDDLKEKLEAEKKRKLTKQSIEQLEKKITPLIAHNRELSETIGQLTVKLEQEEINREKKRARLNEYNDQRDRYAPWKELNRLIGSADGKRYRNFAQGLTFEVMVGHANQQLAGMTDRYLLQRDSDPGKALTLNVVDHYQGGEIRPTTNLSGGETFIVSLALALGLSQMASDQVRVDSLFLDEGFGTLDEETLEEALDALANLKKEEKLIGVISHVPALKERLSVQLKVEQKSGGRSCLAGPGVSIPESE